MFDLKREVVAKLQGLTFIRLHLALDGVYHPLWAVLPNNPTLWTQTCHTDFPQFKRKQGIIVDWNDTETKKPIWWEVGRRLAAGGAMYNWARSYQPVADRIKTVIKSVTENLQLSHSVPSTKLAMHGDICQDQGCCIEVFWCIAGSLLLSSFIWNYQHPKIVCVSFGPPW